MTIILQAVSELIHTLESAGELTIREEKFLKLAKAYQQLAAENVGLKTAHPQPFGQEMMNALDAYEKHQDECPEIGMLDAYFILRDSICITTPATDRIYSGIKADGVEEFAAKLRIPGDDPFFDAIAIGVAGTADQYAQQLREVSK